MTRPLVLAEGVDVDPFATAAVQVLGKALAAGMVMMDRELGVPAAVIDHRIGAVRGTGEIAFLVFDLDASRWSRVNVHGNSSVPVLAS